jgi:hypothetical protein
MAAALDFVPLLPALVPIVVGASVRTIPRLRDSSQPVSDRLRFGGPPSRSLPLGMLGGFATLPLASWLMGRPLEVTIAFLAVLLMVVMRRITAGLRKELKSDGNKKAIVLHRLLYDRGFL